MYIGMTNNFPRRVWEHKNLLVKGLTKIYNVHKVVYIEEISEVTTAIAREKELKKWRRKKKNQLIEQLNPSLEDLCLQW